MKTKYVNSQMLRKMGACEQGVARFEAIFGSAEVKINRKNCMLVTAHDLRWLAGSLFHPQIVLEYDKDCDALDEQFDKVNGECRRRTHMIKEYMAYKIAGSCLLEVDHVEVLERLHRLQVNAFIRHWNRKVKAGSSLKNTV